MSVFITMFCRFISRYILHFCPPVFCSLIQRPNWFTNIQNTHRPYVIGSRKSQMIKQESTGYPVLFQRCQGKLEVAIVAFSSASLSMPCSRIGIKMKILKTSSRHTVFSNLSNQISKNTESKSKWIFVI